MIYLDHAATTPMSDAALQKMKEVLSENWGNPSSQYGMGRQANALLESSRAEMAALLHCSRNEIFFTSGGTESDNSVVYGLAAAQPQKKHIITSPIEHHAMLEPCAFLASMGYEISYLPVNSDGFVSPDDLERFLRDDTLFVSVMMANNETGAIQPVHELARTAQKYGVPFHTDAVQAVGHIPVNLEEMPVSLLSLSGHKFGGPKGIGALFVREGTRLAETIRGGAQEHHRRAGTENVAAVCAMTEALKDSIRNENAGKIASLRDYLRNNILGTIPDVYLSASMQSCLPGHLYLRIAGVRTEALLIALDMEGICASATSACEAGAVEKSHVLEAMKIDTTNMALLRLTVGRNNTKEEMEKVITVLQRVIPRLRSFTA